MADHVMTAAVPPEVPPVEPPVGGVVGFPEPSTGSTTV